MLYLNRHTIAILCLLFVSTLASAQRAYSPMMLPEEGLSQIMSEVNIAYKPARNLNEIVNKAHKSPWALDIIVSSAIDSGTVCILLKKAYQTPEVIDEIIGEISACKFEHSRVFASPVFYRHYTFYPSTTFYVYFEGSKQFEAFKKKFHKHEYSITQIENHPKAMLVRFSLDVKEYPGLSMFEIFEQYRKSGLTSGIWPSCSRWGESLYKFRYKEKKPLECINELPKAITLNETEHSEAEKGGSLSLSVNFIYLNDRFSMSAMPYLNKLKEKSWFKAYYIRENSVMIVLKNVKGITSLWTVWQDLYQTTPNGVTLKKVYTNKKGQCFYENGDISLVLTPHIRAHAQDFAKLFDTFELKLDQTSPGASALSFSSDKNCWLYEWQVHKIFLKNGFKTALGMTPLSLEQFPCFESK